MTINRKQLLKKYIDFFKENGHQEIKNSSLVPENDPTVLFTTAGMHPLVPFLLGEKHPQGKRLCNVQRCIRTGDIDSVGDETHHTFFEMLGNWSLGDYSKDEAIKLTFEFHTNVLGIPLERYAVTVFGGDKRVSEILPDEESATIWSSLGVPESRIKFLEGGVLEAENNWWGPAGKTGPCGPCTEQFFWKDNNTKAPAEFNPDDKNWVEIGNDVLMHFLKDSNGKYIPAAQKNIDFGGGLERTIAVLNGLSDNYLGDMWLPIIRKIEELSKKDYNNHKREMRIIADHLKAACFILADGISPSNSGQGYVLRRLIRRAVRYGRILDLNLFLMQAAEPIFTIYDDYSHLIKNKNHILEELNKEESRFLETLDKGIVLFNKITRDKEELSGADSFLLYQSYGFPIEMTLELAKENKIKVDLDGFEQENRKHQELSKSSSAGVFRSGLADNSEQTTRLHTATHLLNEALRKVLGRGDIFQRGSNITSERLRFDFNFDRKLTAEEIQKIEDLVNEQISKNLDVRCEEMELDEAKKFGAKGVFDSKYGEKVKVYSVGDFSKEICAGPHVKNLSELGKFKILKEESSSAGVRRIKAVLV